MKVFVYSWREFDEKEYFEKFAPEFEFELGYTVESPSMDNIELARGSDFISILTTPVDAQMLDRLKEMGVRMVSTRTIGYNHIDVAHAKEIGMAVSHITYDPEGVADYTVMLILMVLRRYGRIEEKGARNDFSLPGLMGRELRNLTVGFVGAGRVARSVMRDLSGFECRMVYCNRTRREEADRYAEYMSFEDVLEQADILTLHLELNPDTMHIIDANALSKMKPGALIVNTARGGLVDTHALAAALRSGHIAGAGLDVIEGEFDMCYYDRSGEDYHNAVLEEVRGLPNVIHT